MHQPDPSSPPGAHERARRRGLFSGRSEPTPPVPSSPVERIDTVMSAYQEMLREQLEEGLRSIQHEANTLMHDIASEVWRAAGGDKGDLRSKIVETLSRDQALRGLIAHTDERFQAIAVRTSRLEDTLNMLSGSIRAAKQQIEESVERLESLDSHPAVDAAQLRSQLRDITEQISVAFQTLAQRDRAIVESVRLRVGEHAEMVSQEATRIVKAMESYVQHGVEAMGRLASATEARLEALGAGEDVGPRLAQAVEAQTARLEDRLNDLGGYLDHLQERIGIESRDLTREIGAVREASGSMLIEGFTSLDDRMAGVTDHLGEVARRVGAVDQRTAAVDQRTAGLDQRLDGLDVRIGAAVQAQAKALAQLVRSDSEALRRELVRTAAERDEATARILDERLGRVSTTLAEATQGLVDQVTTRMTLAVQGQLERLGRTLSEQSAQAVEVAVARGVVVEARMQSAVESMERAAASMTDMHEDAGSALTDAIDVRIGSLAKLVRADNEALAEQIVADQEATKQALRAIKELQASLPAEVTEMVEQRFVSLAESIERSNEMLAKRIDRMADKIGERYDNDIQVVIDRMGDAMHALASLGKAGAGSGPGPRIELD